MRIHRSRPGSHFTMTPNETLRDQYLSYEARGVLAEILSYPDGWNTNADAIWHRAREERGERAEGRDAIRAAFAELEAAGYLERVRSHGGRGRIRTEIHVYDVSPGRTDDGTVRRRRDLGKDTSSLVAPTTEIQASAGQASVRPSSARSGLADVSPGRTDDGDTAVGQPGIYKKTDNEEREISARKRADDYDDPAFGEFWGVYPLKKDMRAAWKAWQAALRRGADPAAITAAAKRYAEDPARSRAYTKYPATWLNAESYADEEPGPEPEPEMEYTAWMG
jgi:hypothetical protein